MQARMRGEEGARAAQRDEEGGAALDNFGPASLRYVLGGVVAITIPYACNVCICVENGGIGKHRHCVNKTRKGFQGYDL